MRGMIYFISLFCVWPIFENIEIFPGKNFLKSLLFRERGYPHGKSQKFLGKLSQPTARPHSRG